MLNGIHPLLTGQLLAQLDDEPSLVLMTSADGAYGSDQLVLHGHSGAFGTGAS